MFGNYLQCRLILIFAQLLFLFLISSNVSAQNDLVVEGNVLGYELFKIRPVSNVLFPVLFKTTKVIQGTEKSEYIVVLLQNLYEEYAEENFGLDKITVVKLKRQKFCDRKIKIFFRPGSTIENGRIVKVDQTFTLVYGVEKSSLSLKRKVPCYLESFDK